MNVNGWWIENILFVGLFGKENTCNIANKFKILFVEIIRTVEKILFFYLKCTAWRSTRTIKNRDIKSDWTE
jgi:hypothetical protein